MNLVCNLSGAVIQYSQDYSQIQFTFTYPVVVNSPLNSSLQQYSDINCQQVLVQSVVDHLGQGYSCALGLDNQSFIIKLGFGSTLSDNVIIAFNDFKIRTNLPSCPSTYITSFGINKVTKPNSSQQPIAVLSTNTQNFNICQRIQIYVSSISNAGGRPLQNFAWNEATNKVTIPAAYINQPILILESNTLSQNTNYQFILTFQSSYGVAGQSSILISTLDNSLSLQLNVVNAIDGSNTYNFYSYQGIQLQALVSANSCQTSLTQFTISQISWKQQFGNFNGIDLRSDTLKNNVVGFNMVTLSFAVSPYIPLPKDKYEFIVDVLVVDSSGSVTPLQKTVYITILQAPLIVQILGGDTVQQWNKAFNLVAYVYDPNTKQQFQSNSQVSISWKCTIDGTNSDCLWYDGTSFTSIANNQLSVLIPERTFHYFQRIQLSVIVRKLNIDGTVQSGTANSEIMFLDYSLQSFQIQFPPQLSQGYISFTDKILFNINDSNLNTLFANQLDSLTFKTSIQYQGNTYFQKNSLQGFIQFFSIFDIFSLGSLQQQDSLKITFEIDSPQSLTQYQTSYRVFAVDTPKNCQLSLSSGTMSITNCQSQFTPLKYKIALYLAGKVTTIDDINQIQNHEYISLQGLPFSISNTFSNSAVNLSFDILPEGSTEESYLIQFIVQDSNGSVSKQVKKIKNLIFSDQPSSSQNTSIETLISFYTLQSYYLIISNYVGIVSNQSTTTMSNLNTINEDTICHFNYYWSNQITIISQFQNNGQRLLSSQNSSSSSFSESNDNRMLQSSVNLYDLTQTILNNISFKVIPKIFDYEVIWSTYKKFEVYHNQERILFSTFRLIESLIQSASVDFLSSIYSTIMNLCSKALSLTQLNNQPLQYQGKVLNIYLAQYTNSNLISNLSIYPQSYSSSATYQTVIVSFFTSRLFNQLYGFPQGIQRSQIMTYQITQSNIAINLGDVHPVHLSATLGTNFNPDLFICISFRSSSSSSSSTWTSSDCSTVVQKSGVDVICYCKTLDPVVLLEDTEHIFINPSSTDLHEFKDIFKYPILILILSQLILYIVFTVYGITKDEIDLVKVNQTIVPYSLLVPNNKITNQDLEKFEGQQKELKNKEIDFEKQKQEMLDTLKGLQDNIAFLKQNHQTLLLSQQKQIEKIQEEQSRQLEILKQQYEAKLVEIQNQHSNTSFQLNTTDRQKMNELEQNYNKQQEELKDKFKSQNQNLLNEQQKQIKNIENEEKNVQGSIEQQEQNMKAFNIKLNPEEEKLVPKNPIQRILWFMKRGSINEIPPERNGQVQNQLNIEKQPLGKQMTIETLSEDVSPFHANNNNKNIFETENQNLLNKQPNNFNNNNNNNNKEKKQTDNKNTIFSLDMIDDGVSQVGTQVQFNTQETPMLIKDKIQTIDVNNIPPIFQQQPIQQQYQQYPHFSANLNPNTTKFTPLPQIPQIAPDQNFNKNETVGLPISSSQYIKITMKVILVGFFRVHEFFSAVFSYENQISRQIRFTLIFLKYMGMALILGHIENGSYSLNLIFSIPLAFVVSIIANIIITIIKCLIRSYRFFKGLGLILLFASLVFVVYFLTIEFLNVKSPAERWWYAYLIAIGADFIVIEFFIVVIKFAIFNSLYHKKQFHSNFDINMWMLISTNDITNYLIKS